MQVEALDGNVLRIGSDYEEDQPLGVWKGGDGVCWRHPDAQRYEWVEKASFSAV